LPPTIGLTGQMRWNRAAMFATGALTVQDLLDRVLGNTVMRSGWLAAPAVSAYLGDVRSVRVFIDGVERDELDPRNGRVLDLTQINLWSFEEAAIERAGGEVRVYLNSWRVNLTTPSTRTDVATGDQQTNLYRGFFGKRFKQGYVVQFAAQQYGTTPPLRFGASSDQLGLFARLGWASRGWTIDGVAHRTSRHRGLITSEFVADSIPGLEASRLDAYARVAYGDADTSATWVQLIASGQGYQLKPTTTTFVGDSLARDTSRFRGQYILAVGGSAFGMRVSATERLRAGDSLRLSTPSLRASYQSGLVDVSAFVSGKDADSVATGDVTARFTPLTFLALSGSVGRSSDSGSPDTTVAHPPNLTTNYMRAEVGLRLGGLWFIGGVIRRDSVRLAAPVVFSRKLARVTDSSATGMTAAIRGHLWKIINVDAQAIRWSDSTGLYRPQYQTRSEVSVFTQLLDRFPSGNLSILAGLVHEYRSNNHFPVENGVVAVTGYRTLSSLIEIRVLSAVVSWQFRNFLGERYTQVPDFAAPRQTSIYGVRWEFWN
jgi:hypothetical protein